MRGRLLGGGETGLLEASRFSDEVGGEDTGGGDGAGVLAGILGRGTVGSGQVMSRYCLSQNGRILSNKHHWRSGDSPAGCTVAGNSVALGVHSSLMRSTGMPSVSLYFLQMTVPGDESCITNCWNDLIPVTFFILVAKKEAQSYVGT